MKDMIVTQHEKVKPNYDPYEECCAGSHNGEAVEIKLKSGPNVLPIILKIQQSDSGIGASWTVSVDDKEVFSTFYCDCGGFVLLNKGTREDRCHCGF